MGQAEADEGVRVRGHREGDLLGAKSPVYVSATFPRKSRGAVSRLLLINETDQNDGPAQADDDDDEKDLGEQNVADPNDEHDAPPEQRGCAVAGVP